MSILLVAYSQGMQFVLCVDVHQIQLILFVIIVLTLNNCILINQQFIEDLASKSANDPTIFAQKLKTY